MSLSGRFGQLPGEQRARFLPDGVRERIDSPFHLVAQLARQREPRALDSVHDDLLRQTSERPRELDRLGDTDRVTRGAPERQRDRIGCRVEAVNRSCHFARAHGVHEYDRIGVAPELE